MKSKGRENLELKKQIFAALPLFEDIKANDEALTQLAFYAWENEYAPGTNIIVENESGAELYVLIEGRASVLKHTSDGDHYKVAVLDSAHKIFFGEGGLLPDETRNATIQADTRCRCLVLSKSSFDDYCAKNPQWALPILLRITQKVMGRLRHANQDILLLYNALVAEMRGE